MARSLRKKQQLCDLFEILKYVQILQEMFMSLNINFW